jgi:hypothetical protein
MLNISNFGNTADIYAKFLISNFRHVLNIVYILLGIAPESGCGLPTFRNPRSGPSSTGLTMDLTDVSETSAKHNLKPGKYPKNIYNLCDSPSRSTRVSAFTERHI